MTCTHCGQEVARGTAHVPRGFLTVECDEVQVTCGICGKPATCIGTYEGQVVKTPACDDCCGHGNEDGHCEPVLREMQHVPRLDCQATGWHLCRP